MNADDPQPRQLLITRASQRPSTTEVKRIMARLSVGEVSDAAVEQLIAAMPAANRWLAEHPEEAARLLEDPVAAVHAMQKSGALTESVADLLVILRSLRKTAEGTRKARARLERLLRPTSASFGPKPALRFGSDDYDQSEPPEEREGH